MSDLYADRRWVFLNSGDVASIDFNQVMQTSAETLRYCLDGTKTFVKYEGYKPKFLYGKPAFSYNKILDTLNDIHGEWYIEDTSTDI